MHSDALMILLPAVLAFLVGMMMTPLLAHVLYTQRMWKKTSVVHTIDGGKATISAQLHNDEVRKTPRMGGIIIWASTLITVSTFALPSIFWGGKWGELNFLSRNQTWLPLFTLIAGALCGLVDDYLVCRDQGTYRGGGLSLTARLTFVALLGALGAWWFYGKLGMSSIDIPFFGPLELGILFIPVFLLYMIGLYSGGIIDGVDGLAGGVFAALYGAYGIIAYVTGYPDIAAYCGTVIGGILAFLWFNIPPARFFCSETGTMALTTSLVVVAFLIDAAAILLLIALPLIVTSLSSIIQIASKRLRHGKKVFLVAPLHNHFQAMGWPAAKVTMRYWVASTMLATLGVILHLMG
jgi:phospho-N-acetylmuramoyl-pentapeptide-transferase